ncbi:glutamate--tRNA ligase [bacterium]|nr:glutamate--tRNA ligase [bacterium]NCQ54767.1 glutamate--tRNA ligase [Candidatus Parcubacteria bacterium]NCS68020.1 glutamate--tRNA ligase [Candidatus Peregrinibacteria bacterium]NCS95757.1 glutamate--tRNA ligase [bacterium]
MNTVNTRPVVVRMPPSPTGHLHLGTARTALFNYLFAKKHQGEIVFRWEDTDKERSKTEHETEILEGLKWLGLDFEKESSLMVRQTESIDHHTEVLRKLWEAGKVFPCFTTPAELDVLREEAQQNKTGFVFWSPYREKDKATLETEMKSGRPFAWRLKVEQNQIISYIDEIRGETSVNSSTLGDFVVARSDGSVLYLLANVIDDHEQGITHVIRGEDHISNTPKQLLCWKALGVEPPIYAHIPLVLDAQKRKLSKRRVEPGVAVLVPDFQAQGFVPEAVLNGLAFLGWNPKITTDEIFSLPQLEEIFDLAGVNKAAAQYDFEKMRWYNQQWLQSYSETELTERFMDWTKTFDADNSILLEAHKSKLPAVLPVVAQKAKTFAEFYDELVYFLEAPKVDHEALVNEKMKISSALAKSVLEELASLLQDIDESDFTAETIKEKSIESIAKMELKNGQFLSPFRFALSGREKSAGPFEIAAIIGKEESLRRINAYH